MTTERNFVAVEVSQDVLRSIWNALELGPKLREGLVTFEPQPRYAHRTETQVGIVRLK